MAINILGLNENQYTQYYYLFLMSKDGEEDSIDFKTYNRPKKEDLAYQQMIAQLEQDILELSFKNNNISDYAFAKWNSSAYHTNSKGNLVLNRNLKVGFDVPKSINTNIKVPTQKYKHKYCYSY